MMLSGPEGLCSTIREQENLATVTCSYVKHGDISPHDSSSIQKRNAGKVTNPMYPQKQLLGAIRAA